MMDNKTGGNFNRIFDTGSKPIIVFAIFIFAVFLALSLNLTGNYAMDETVFHFPNVLNFYKNGPAATFNKAYSAANTPLPYIIVAAIAWLFSPTIVLARTVTAVLSFFTFVLGLKTLKRLRVAPIYSLILLFYPYFFLNSFIFYVINFGLFFCLLSLFLLSSAKQSYWHDLGVGLGLTMAILCQQFYLMVLAAVLLTRLISFLQHRKQQPAYQERSFMLSSLLLSLPALLPLAIFYKWGGLVHSNFRVHQLAFFPTDFTGLFMVLGFYFFPYALQKITKKDYWKPALSLLAGIVLALYFRPGFNDINGPDIFNGIVYHIVEAVSDGIPWLETVLMALLSGAGVLFFIKLAGSNKTDFDKTLFIGACLLSASYVLNAVFGERHMLPLLFLLFLLVLPRLNTLILKFYLPAMMLAGISYYFFWLFIKY